MRTALLILLFLASAVPAVAAEVIDQASAVRNTVLRAEPASSAAPAGEVAIGQALDVYERRGLWVDVGFVRADGPARGWLRLTELRFGGAGASSASASAPAGGGFAGFSRSVSGFLSRFRGRAANTQTSTSTIGIRGLSPAELQTAAPNLPGLNAIQAYAVTEADAEQFAGVGGLRARDVAVNGEQQ